MQALSLRVDAAYRHHTACMCVRVHVDHLRQSPCPLSARTSSHESACTHMYTWTCMHILGRTWTHMHTHAHTWTGLKEDNGTCCSLGIFRVPRARGPGELHKTGAVPARRCRPTIPPLTECGPHSLQGLPGDSEPPPPKPPINLWCPRCPQAPQTTRGGGLCFSS